MRLRTFLGIGLLLLLAWPSFGAQSFDLTYQSFDDRNGNGFINCLEQVIFRVTLVGTAAPVGGDRGRITVPFGNPDFWTYIPGSFQPVLIEGCTVSILSGTGITDPAVILDYICDPRAGNPLDDSYVLSFEVTGRFFSNTSGGLGVAARNERTSPTAEIQDDFAISGDPGQPCPVPPDLRLTKSLTSGNGSPGATLVYTLTVNNFGGSAADDVTLEENVPAHTTFSPAGSSPGWLCLPNNSAGASCTLGVGTVAAGSSVTRTFSVVVDSSLPPNPGDIGNTACVSTSTSGDAPEDNCGSTSTPGGNPDLRMAKSVASGSGQPGATLTYDLTISNLGTRDASSATVQETVPNHTTFSAAGSSAGWTCSPNGNAGAACTLPLGTVPAGATLTRAFAVVVDPSLPANPGNIGNTACVSTTTAGDPPGDNCGSTSTPPGGNPDLRTVKSLASGSGDPGATLVYDLLVSNIGNRGAAGVQLSETVPALATFLPVGSSPGWSCSPNNNAGSTCVLALGTLAAGASSSGTFTVQLAATFPANPPPIDNTACSSTSTPGDPAGNNCGSVSTPPGGNPDLRTVKSLESGSGDPGATLVYSLSVSNLGNRDAEGVQLNETVPALATFLPASSSPGWICTPDNGAGSSCVLTLGTVAAGTSASRSFAVQLAATFPANPPSIDNTACSTSSTSGDPAGDNCGSVSTPPGGNPDLRMNKSVASGSGDPGATLVYSLVVTNLGNRDAAGVELTETVPQLTTFLPEASSPGWACTPDGNAGSSCTLGIGSVAAGTSATYTFAVQVASTFPPNPPPIDNTACVSSPGSGDPTGNDCGTTTTPPGGNPDVRIAKSVASGTGDPGSVLVYQLAVSNIGTRDAEGVTLEESVPQLTSYLSSGSSAGWTCAPDGNAGSSCTLAIGTVAAGSSATYTFGVQVASSFPPNPPPIDNTACVSTTSDGDPTGNDCGSTSTPPGGNPDLRISKSVASGTADPGSVLVYQLSVSNAGTREAGGVILEETVPQLTSYLATGSSPGWTCTPDGSAGSSCTLLVGTVGAGASATYTFAVQVASTFPPNPPPIDNTACVSTTSSGDPAGNDCGSTSTPPGGHPDLVLTKSLTSGTVVPNGLLVFTLTLRNQGSREATGVVLEETVLADSTFEAVSSSPGWNCLPNGSAGSTCSLVVGTVAAGASSSHVFAVRLRSDLATGTSLSNTACVDQTPVGNGSEGDTCATVIVDPPGPQTRTDVEVALGVDGPQPPGTPLIFTLTLHNSSSVAAEGLRVMVSLPSFGTEPTELDPACEYRMGSVIECSLPELAGGDSVSFTWKHAALQLGDYTVSAELMTATPEDLDSTPANGVKIEDDYAEIVVSVAGSPGVHDIPTLSTFGILAMVVLLVALGVLFLKRGAAKRATSA